MKNHDIIKRPKENTKRLQYLLKELRNWALEDTKQRKHLAKHIYIKLRKFIVGENTKIIG